MNKKASKNIEGWENIQRHAEERFHQEIKELRRLVKIWRDSELVVKKDSSEAAILLQYATCVEEVNNSDRLKELFFVKPIKYQEETKGLKDEKTILLGISFLDQKDWKISFSKNFIKKIKSLSDPSILHIFFKLYLTGEGLIPFTEGKEGTYKTYQRQCNLPLEYYTLEIDHQDHKSYLLITVGVHKVPHFDFNNANGAKINDFAYVMMVTAEDIIHEASFYNQKFMKMIAEGIEDYYEENPRINYEKAELKMNLEAMNDKKNYYHSKKRDNQLGTKVCPTAYKSNIPGLLEIENFYFLLDKFNDYKDRVSYLAIEKEIKEKMKQKQHQQMQRQQEDEENQLIEILEMETVRNEKFQFQNHSKILHYLQQIPNFKYALTKQQKQVLIRNGNLIIVGRSGTGKTTCAMLRLYGIEFLVKMNEFNSLKRQGKIEITQEKCAIMLLNEIQLLKNIFLTFSGRLIDEIKKQYDDMIFQIHDKHSQKCQLCKTTLKKNNLDDEEEDPLDKLKRQEEEQQRKVISLSSIGNEDFPGFFTIENFIRIIDKTVPRPFFSHKKQHQNEKNNAIIKHAYINRYEYTSADIKLIQTFEAVYVDYNFFAKHIWQELPRQLTRASRQLCLLTPPIVWSELFSILKGSLKSYLCPGGYISFKMYLDDHQSIFQKQPERMYEYKEKVYKILKSYINWCRNENGYDLMDVVNHNLRQIEFYGYSGPKINYMFVDEVQDLTSSTTFLISKMVLNNIFYCGDTAQAITKGVNFRFQDLKFIFNKQYCKNALELDEPEEIIYLTVNFRSHHFILQLANSIVSSIQQLFPNSITKIKKEKSDLIGPKPFVLLDQNTAMLFYLICGPVEIKMDNIDGEQHLNDVIKESQKKQREKMKKKKKKGKNKEKRMDEIEQNEDDFNEIDSEDQQQTRRFNSQQIIIVRNLQQKRKLPGCLKKGIVLVPESAKGLEFDEVILYNFFSSCPIFQKWNSLLQHLDPEQFYEDQKKFQEQLSRRSKQQKNEQEPLTDQIKKMLGYDQNRKQYRIWNIRGRQSIRGLNINLYLELASQLKILYTVITRSRSVFAIFDDKIPKHLLNLWKTLDLVTIVDEKNVEECHRSKNDYVYVKEKHKKYINPDRHWFKAGSQMLARKDYENAKKCFANIKRNDLVQRIEALEMEIKAQNILYRVNNGLKKLQALPRDERKIKKIKLQREKTEAYQNYRTAGKIYQKYARNNDSAYAYFKAGDFELALKYYKLTQNNDKIAICCKKLKRYKQAIEIFKEQEDIEAIVQCYIEQKNWVELFNMLINNPEYMHKFEELNDIALDCIKNVLYKKIHSDKVMEAQRHYKQYYGIQVMKDKESKKRIEDQQFTTEIKKMVFQYELSNLWRMHQKIQVEVNKYKQLQEKYFSAKARLELVYEQEEKLIEKIEKIKLQKSDLLQTERIFIDKVEVYQLEYLAQQRQQIQTYKLIKQQLQTLKLQKADLYKTHHQLNNQINELHVQMLELQPIQSRYREEYEQYSKKYEYKKNQTGLELIQKQLTDIVKKIELLTNKKSLKSGTVNRVQNDYNDYLSEISSVSDLTEMKDVWDFDQNNIGGLQLHGPDKEKLLQQINQILKISVKLLDGIIQSDQKPYHHNYIEQKMFKLLNEKSTALNYNNYIALRNANKVGQNTSCLLICDVHKEFICLSPKYILGYLLNFSQNFKQNRYFQNELYEIQTKNNESQAEQDQDEQLSEVEAFLATLNDNGLMHKIPRLAFQDKFYYETILANISFGLILQGYSAQLSMFLQPGPACKLAYLYSNYEQLISLVKDIAKGLKIKNLKDKTFLFTQDERILSYYPQVSVLNIFSIQNIFYAYDQCQNEPFLSKKKTQKQFDIEQDIVQRLYDFEADKKIKQMRQQNEILQNEISRLKVQIINWQSDLQTKKSDKETLNRMFGKDKYQIKRSISQMSQILKDQKQYLEKLETDKAKAQYKSNISTLTHGKKRQYEDILNKMLFDISALIKQGKFHQSQRLERKRMDLDQEYKEKRHQQKQLFDDLEKIKTRIKQKQGEINKTKFKLSQLYQAIQIIQANIQSLTPKQIQESYNQIIKKNEKEIQKFQQKLHQQLAINDPQRMKEAVVLLLMKEIKRKRYLDWMSELRSSNMQKILESSNIPYSQHFKFLALYMKGQLSQQNQKRSVKMEVISQIYYNILKDGTQINALMSATQNRQIKDIKICNIIIFYLSFICNQSVRQDVNDALRIAYRQYIHNNQRRNQANQASKSYENHLEFYNEALSKIPAHLRTKTNWNYTDAIHKINEARVGLMEVRSILNECQDYQEDPFVLMQRFMDTIFKKIKYLGVEEMHFMELLFGFFQCRIIRDCQLLNFLANQYVLVKHNSIVIQRLQEESKHPFQRLQEERKHPFAYYFDQKNETVLCRFEDVQRIILGFIDKKHRQIYTINYLLANQQKKQKNKKKYMDVRLFGYMNKEETPQFRQMLQLTQFVNYYQKKSIKQTYDQMFIGDITMKDIKKAKTKIIEYFLKSKFTNPDGFFFASHQLREYYFLEKVLSNLNNFNYELLKDVKKKKEALQRQYQQYIANQK